ncbi:MAG: acyl-CoA desaturase [Bacteroidota bacterium]
MVIKRLNLVRFAPKGKDSFFETVINRVDEYFENNNISPYANAEMWLKTVVVLLMYFVPYALMVTGVAGSNTLVFMGFWFMMGLGMVGIGTSIMHDANHGTYSPNKKINNFISHILEVIGGYTVTWRIQHNVLHHTYTNIGGLDEDIDTMGILRLSPRQPRKWFHRYQYLYAWFFYAIMTLYWMTAKDYVQAIHFKQHNLLIREKISLKMALFRITLYKLFYYTYILILPIWLLEIPWYHFIGGFLLMHITAGLILSCIFQPAHIVETSGFAIPVVEDGNKMMEDSWAIHEIVNTTDFSPNSRIVSWFIGGLNYQIEHHLFTGVCNVHFRNIAPIVRSVTAEFGIPYHVEPSFFKALRGHVRMLIKLGRNDDYK